MVGNGVAFFGVGDVLPCVDEPMYISVSFCSLAPTLESVSASCTGEIHGKIVFKTNTSENCSKTKATFLFTCFIIG